MSPFNTHVGLIPPNPKSIPANDNNEIDADDNNDNNSVGTFNTATIPVNKIKRILRKHDDDKGDGGTSDVDGDEFYVVHDFEIPMNENNDEKFLNDYAETGTCVCDGVNNTSLSGSTSKYLQVAPVE